MFIRHSQGGHEPAHGAASHVGVGIYAVPEDALGTGAVRQSHGIPPMRRVLLPFFEVSCDDVEGSAGWSPPSLYLRVLMPYS